MNDHELSRRRVLRALTAALPVAVALPLLGSSAPARAGSAR